MIRRPLRPHFSSADEAFLLDALRIARENTIKCGGAEMFGFDRYERCRRVTEAIDALAGDLTGDPTRFHAKPHGEEDHKSAAFGFVLVQGLPPNRGDHRHDRFR